MTFPVAPAPESLILGCEEHHRYVHDREEMWLTLTRASNYHLQEDISTLWRHPKHKGELWKRLQRGNWPNGHYHAKQPKEIPAVALNEAGVITGALLLKAISSGRSREVGVIICLLIVLTSHYSHTSNLWEGLCKNLPSVAGLISIKFTAISKRELGAFPSSGCELSRRRYKHRTVTWLS